MTTEWITMWVTPFIWWLIDITWVFVGILLYRALKGKAALLLLISASCAFLLGSISAADAYLSNTIGKQILPYDHPLYFGLFDVCWPFMLLCVAIFTGLATIRIHTIVRRNKELESLLPTSLSTPEHQTSTPPHLQQP